MKVEKINKSYVVESSYLDYVNKDYENNKYYFIFRNDNEDFVTISDKVNDKISFIDNDMYCSFPYSIAISGTSLEEIEEIKNEFFEKFHKIESKAEELLNS